MPEASDQLGWRSVFREPFMTVTGIGLWLDDSFGKPERPKLRLVTAQQAVKHQGVELHSIGQSLAR